MIFKRIALNITGPRIDKLRKQNAEFINHLEHKLPLQSKILAGLQEQLSEIIDKSPEWTGLLQALHDSGDYYLVQLVHGDNEILNLPWSMAKDPVSGQTLGTIPRLTLSKCPESFVREAPAANPVLNAPPMKILVMISSPLDAEHDHRLSYEEEEYLILEALSPLMESGLVHVDFTDDGSLDALKRKLRTNRYHVLHFSGHARFRDGEGMLQLEHPLTLKTENTTAREFAETVNCNPDYRVPLVLLSSCQSAQGGTEKGLCGITNQLLRVDVPAIISMGLSIMDRYATQFAGSFYRSLAQKQNIQTGFNEAVDFIRELERQDQVRANRSPAVPLQWIIPNLYLKQHWEHLVDWEQPHEELKLSSHRFITQNQRLVLAHEEGFRFIGRRRDKAAILPTFFAGEPILIKGQGGVGKTAMAEHLIQRLIAAKPRTVPFVFTETTRTMQEILDTLKNHLLKQNRFDQQALDSLEKGSEKLVHLVARVAEVCRPVFVFDNLEDFQTEPGGKFAAEFQDLREAIDLIRTHGTHHLILTARYPLPDFPGLKVFDLNQVDVNDFWRRSLTLMEEDLAQLLQQAAQDKTGIAAGKKHVVEFIDIVRLLHKTFGGNYRALELFFKLVREHPTQGKKAFKSLEAFEKEYAGERDEVRHEMARDLMFETLLELVEPRRLALLFFMQNFRIPVQAFAVQLQLSDTPITGLEEDLLACQHLTLIELSLDPELNIAYYYVTPLVRDLLGGMENPPPPRPFSHQKAGAYHYHLVHNDIDPGLGELEEAFFHFCEAGNKTRIHELGDRLSAFFHRVSLYANALHCAEQVHLHLEDQTPAPILNRLGLIYDLFGLYDQALKLYKKAHGLYKEIGDKAGEGVTLNNLATTAHAKGDYDTALKYLEKSLKIRQEIGDKAGAIATLHNMGMIALQNQDMEKHVDCEMKAYRLARETGNALGLLHVGQVVGRIFHAMGKKQEGLDILRESLQIGKRAGMPGVEQIEELIRRLERS
ncbi:MAG: CHAT domain-containing protein [Planctomycetes bacterium]|nr:CHAT domain-containing protein [Planctomycetota bacterium]